MAHLQMSSLSLRATSYMLQLQAAASVVILRHRFDIVRYRADDICTITGIGYVRYRTDIATYIGQISLRCRRSDNVALSDIGRRTNLSHPDIGIVSSVQYRCDIVCRRAISHRYRTDVGFAGRVISNHTDIVSNQ